MADFEFRMPSTSLQFLPISAATENSRYSMVYSIITVFVITETIKQNTKEQIQVPVYKLKFLYDNISRLNDPFSLHGINHFYL